MQRDEAAIAHWKRYRWPHIKKRATTWGPQVRRRVAMSKSAFIQEGPNGPQVVARFFICGQR